MRNVQIADTTFLTPIEAAKLLRISRQTLYLLIESGEISAKRVGGQWRIPRESIEPAKKTSE